MSKSRSGNSGNDEYPSTFDSFMSFSDIGTNSSSSSDDVIPAEQIFEDQGESEEGTHASPHEHIVKPHGQHYGKNKVWKEKAAYTRGRKNSDNE